MPEQGGAPPGPMLLFPLIFIGIWYVLVIRPQSKSRKQHTEMLKNLKKHEQVVTTGGLLGTIVNLKPETITLRIDENVRVEIERSAITRVVRARTTEAQPLPAPKQA